MGEAGDVHFALSGWLSFIPSEKLSEGKIS